MTVNEIISTITDTEIEQYNKYWEVLKPKDEVQFHNCFVFSFLSIRTTWQKNVHGFELWGNNKILDIVQAVMDTPDDDPAKPAKIEVMEAAADALQTGLQVKKILSVKSYLKNCYRTDLIDGVPVKAYDFKKKEDESWDKYRSRITKAIDHLGITKASFAIELMYPFESELICLDSRMLKMMKLEKMKLGKRDYKNIEKLWKDECTRKGVSPAIARHIVWSRDNPGGNCTTWANCLDTTGTAAQAFA